MGLQQPVSRRLHAPYSTRQGCSAEAAGIWRKCIKQSLVSRWCCREGQIYHTTPRDAKLLYFPCCEHVFEARKECRCEVCCYDASSLLSIMRMTTTGPPRAARMASQFKLLAGGTQVSTRQMFPARKARVSATLTPSQTETLSASSAADSRSACANQPHH